MQQHKQSKKTDENNFGIASLIVGIMSIILMWIPFVGLAAGIVAIVLRNKQKKIEDNSLATAGMITGIIGLVLSSLYTIIWLIGLLLVGNMAAFSHMAM